ncbi:hypothetical protein PoB_004772500 [Plakobranchus ocellatus]|uniref:Uncharacterized protein n=1 Tax=Plakobranchus ocellatus TaxID=259542 RepID=A0AAV4BL24_9GAST|nr:hypothetical protein PoB_004772500 [Plakobranchus ocellatus]
MSVSIPSGGGSLVIFFEPTLQSSQSTSGDVRLQEKLVISCLLSHLPVVSELYFCLHKRSGMGRLYSDQEEMTEHSVMLTSRVDEFMWLIMLGTLLI